MSPSHLAARCALAASAIIVTTVALAAPASATSATSAITHSAPDAALELSVLGSYETGVFDESAAEIVAYYDGRSYTVNAQKAVVDVVDVSEPNTPLLLYSIGGTGVANSVAIRDDGLGVIALESETKTDAGTLLFFDANTESATALGSVEVGALPDMVTISDDSRYAVVANEGEPSEDFDVDPEGSISVITLPDAVVAPAQDDVRTANFHDFEADGSKTLDPAVRIFGPTPEADLPISRNLEPEYITVSGGTAYAVLQEANAVAVVDLATASVREIWPLGYKDHSIAGNGIDASDRDPEDAPTVSITTHDGLYSAYMPDGISSYTVAGETYLVTANEGDSREWGDFEDAARVKDLGEDGLAPVCETSALANEIGDSDLGRLNVITDLGLSPDGSCYEELYAFGGRSFSIWTTAGELVFDSGDGFEQVTAEAIAEFFNSNHSESNREGRSDDKGPEPESVTLGEIDGSTYAFVGFERVGGIAVYDVTNPVQSSFVTYLNNRDFSISVEDAEDPGAVLSAAGDLGPEGIAFVPAAASPTGEAMLVVGNEVSGTTSYYRIAQTGDEGTDPGDTDPGDGAGDAEPGTGADPGDGDDSDGASGPSNEELGTGAGSIDSAVPDSAVPDSAVQDRGAADGASGELPYTGIDVGLVGVFSALAAAVISSGAVVLIVARRRATR